MLSFLLILAASAAFAQDGEMPEGQLTHFEFTTTYRDGKFLSQCSTATLQSDGRVKVTCFDFYDNMDSCTVYASRDVLADIRTVIAKEAAHHSMNKDVTWLNGETGTGQTHHFRATFEGGDTLAMNGYIARYGMRDIQIYLKKVCEREVRNMPMQEVKGIADYSVFWHAGGRYGCQEDIVGNYPRGTKVKRYKVQGKEILVLRNAKTSALLDVYVRVKDRGRCHETIEEAYVKLIGGVYENDTGRSAFGKVTFSHDEIQKGGVYPGDPGSELHFDLFEDEKGIHLTDTLYWGMSRIKERNDAPADAPPGWGGHGAIAGPTKWVIRFTSAGLECEELEAPMYCDTYPAFGKKFVLKKVRSAYEGRPEPWAVISEEPLVRDLLKKLAPRQLRAMLADLKARHADGSPLTPLEKINQELVKRMLLSKK